jgi:hypothetical protein
MENDLNDFIAKFCKLMEEAKSYGLDSVICLSETNLIGEETSTYINYMGNQNACLGLMCKAQQVFLNRCKEL